MASVSALRKRVERLQTELERRKARAANYESGIASTLPTANWPDFARRTWIRTSGTVAPLTRTRTRKSWSGRSTPTPTRWSTNHGRPVFPRPSAITCCRPRADRTRLRCGHLQQDTAGRLRARPACARDGEQPAGRDHSLPH